MHRKPFKIIVTPKFEEWFAEQNTKEREQIRSRASHIEIEGYFADHKPVSYDNTVWELGWKNGRRIYYAYIAEDGILLLTGGNKNGQKNSISQAKRIYASRIQN